MLRNKVAHESIRSPLETVYLKFKLKKKRSNLKRIRQCIYVKA